MPTYTYKCSKCMREFDIFQKMTDDPLRVCPVCGGALVRQIGPGMGFIFKGSGFYATDYRSESYKQGEKREKSQISSDSGKAKSKGNGGKSKGNTD